MSFEVKSQESYPIVVVNNDDSLLAYSIPQANEILKMLEHREFLIKENTLLQKIADSRKEYIDSIEYATGILIQENTLLNMRDLASTQIIDNKAEEIKFLKRAYRRKTLLSSIASILSTTYITYSILK